MPSTHCSKDSGRSSLWKYSIPSPPMEEFLFATRNTRRQMTKKAAEKMTTTGRMATRQLQFLKLLRSLSSHQEVSQDAMGYLEPPRNLLSCQVVAQAAKKPFVLPKSRSSRQEVTRAVMKSLEPPRRSLSKSLSSYQEEVSQAPMKSLELPRNLLSCQVVAQATKKPLVSLKSRSSRQEVDRATMKSLEPPRSFSSCQKVLRAAK